MKKDNFCLVCTEPNCASQRCKDVIVDIEEIKTKSVEELIKEIYG